MPQGRSLQRPGSPCVLSPGPHTVVCVPISSVTLDQGLPRRTLLCLDPLCKGPSPHTVPLWGPGGEAPCGLGGQQARHALKVLVPEGSPILTKSPMGRGAS